MGTRPGVRRALRALQDEGLTQREPDGRWRLTLAGAARGRRLVEGDDPLPADTGGPDAGGDEAQDADGPEVAT